MEHFSYDLIEKVLPHMEPAAMFRLAHVHQNYRAVAETRSDFCFWSTSAQVLDAVAQQRNCEVLGPAGCGKSTLLSRIYDTMTERRVRVSVIAPTQAAAELIPFGETIHAFLHIKSTEKLATLEEWYTKYQERGTFGRIFGARPGGGSRRPKPLPPFPDLLLCDEVSMIGSNLLENMDYILRHRRDCPQPNKMFGGATVVFFGDFCQLPPVGDSRAFKWDKWEQVNMVHFHLDKPLRQVGDKAWFRYLQNVRQGSVLYIRESDGGPIIIGANEYDELMKQEKPPFVLSAVNEKVEKMNADEFARVPGPTTFHNCHDVLVQQDPLTKRFRVVAEHLPTPEDSEIVNRCYRLQQTVHLKIGARYVITMNLNKKRGIYNGQQCEYIGDGRFRLYSNDEMVMFDDLVTDIIMKTRREVRYCALGVRANARIGRTVHPTDADGIATRLCADDSQVTGHDD